MSAKPKAKTTTSFTFAVPTEVDQLLEEKAGKENLSKGDLFRRMLVLGIEQSFSLTVEHNKLVKIPK